MKPIKISGAGMKKLTIVALPLALLAVLFADGCKDNAPSGPTPGLGSVTVTKYVSIGNSLTAGWQSNGLYESAQIYSYPNLIAGQLVKAGAGIDAFKQPLWRDPGTPDPNTGFASRLQIISLNGPVIAPANEAVTAAGPTDAATLPRPYDNLGIPGIPLAGFMDTTGTYQASPLGDKAILRWNNPGSPFPKSVFLQVKAMQPKPDLITFWLGANDVLGFATSGGVSPSTPTDPAIFQFLYAQALDSLRANFPNAKIIVGNIPRVETVPFFTTVGPLMAEGIAGARKLSSAIQGLYYQKHTDANVGTGLTQLTEPFHPLITLKGIAYAELLGQPTGQWYRDIAAANHVPLAAVIPPQIDTTKPFGFHPQNPWPNALALDSTEQAMAEAAINSFNTTISTVAASKGAVLFDANALLVELNTSGYNADGSLLTSEYIAGGAFSLDGIHPSDRGYGVVANEIIKVMNSRFGMSVPLVDINSLPGIPAPLSKVSPDRVPVISYSAFKDFDWLFRQSNQ
ncbi:MAG TPA: SGNH/GDSL hydrolase family protein [Bacteroidota bacterium]